MNVQDSGLEAALVEACRRALANCRYPQINVAAAVSTTDGRIFAAVQVRSRTCSHCSTCAEPVAIGMALAAGADGFDTCVALHRSTGTVLSPCGSCRELLRDHGFRHVIVHLADGRPVTATPDELLPWS